MAAETPATGYPRYAQLGPFRVVIAKFTDPAHANTWDTGLEEVIAAHITSCDSTALAAADSLSFTANSAGTLTFGVIGTARDCYVTAFGL